MIELQKYWDNVLQERNKIKKNEDSIISLNNEIENKKNEFNALDEILKKLKIDVNEKELELSGIEEHIKKLEIKNEKVTDMAKKP